LTRPPRHYAAARRSYWGELADAGQDFASSFRQSRLWTTLAIHDIAARYRGSILGPFWITITSAIFVAGIALVYGGLMQVSVEKYVPWLAAGVTVWNLISGMMIEGGDAFIAGGTIIRQSSLPLPLFIWRVVFRVLLNFAHQVVVVFAIAVWFKFILHVNLLAFVAGLAALVFNMAWVAFLTAIISARFRDIQQIIAASMQLLFFVSPVIWIPKEMSGIRGSLLQFNPFYHMLEVTRNPLIGLPAPMHSFMVLGIMGLIGWAVTFAVYGAVRRRIVHYL
jgi:lipopolysaccharide transport system permease protein